MNYELINNTEEDIELDNGNNSIVLPATENIFISIYDYNLLVLDNKFLRLVYDSKIAVKFNEVNQEVPKPAGDKPTVIRHYKREFLI